MLVELCYSHSEYKFLPPLSPSLFFQARDRSPVLTVPDGMAVQEIKLTVGTHRKWFHLDVGVVYGVNDTLTVNKPVL